MRREAFAVLLVFLAVVTLAVIVVSPSSARPPSCEVNPNPARCRTSTPTPTTPTPTPTTPTPTPTPTTTAPGPWSCANMPLGDGCPNTGSTPGYVYADIPNSNGYNTYVANQDVGANTTTTESLSANNPGDWQVVADAQPYGYLGVQTFPDVQQLFNNWSGPGAIWEGGQNTPLAELSTLSVNYAETSPTSPNSIYEFAPDIWQDNYSSDVMFWVDTFGRCDEGAFGGTVLGHTVIDGQGWTVHRYGGFGAEIIFVLDGAGGAGTCAQQHSGTVNIKAGLEWLLANGFVNGPIMLTQVNTGWEVTSADNQTFTVTQYSITAN